MDKLIQVLGMVKPVAKLIPVAGQYLEPSLEILMELLKMHEQFKSNKTTLDELVDRAASLSLTIVDNLKGVPKDQYDKKLEPQLKALLDSFKETHTYFQQRQANPGRMSRLGQVSRKAKNLLRSSADKEALQKLSKRLDDAIQQFLLLSGMRQLLKTDEIGGYAKKFARWVDDLLLEKLKPVNDALFSTSQETCSDGTFAVLLDELVAWVTSRDAQRVYWLSGQAGTGKSTVARTFCYRLEESPDIKSEFVLSFFVSSRHEADRRTPRRIVHTLSYYLARALPNFRAEVLSRLDARPYLPTRDVSTLWDELIENPLEHCASDQHPTVVLVIDAFDECDADDHAQKTERRKFLCSLLRIVKKSKVHVRLLFSSRKMPFIDGAFHDYRPLPASGSRTIDCVPFLYEHKIELSLLHADIKMYFDQAFKNIVEEKKELVPVDWPAPNDIRILVEQANRLFIYAATVVRFVGDGLDPAHNLEVIMAPGASSSSSASPEYATLDGMYDRVLTTASSSTAGPRAASHKAAVIQLVLSGLVVLLKPLTAAALAALLEVGATKVEVADVIRQLAAVLTVDGSGSISFYHASFRDYLLDKDRCVNPSFRIDPTDSHRTLATGCFANMNNSLRSDMADLGDPSTLVEDVPELSGRISAAFPPVLIYASKYWCHHLKQSQLTRCGENGSNVLLQAALERFCTTHLLHWIEASSLLGNLMGSEILIISAAECCQAWIGNEAATNNGQLSPHNLARIAAILRDAGRLLSTFYGHIATRPLQAYVCASLFLPNGALLDAVAGSIEDKFKPAQPVVRAATWNTLVLKLKLNLKDRYWAYRTIPGLFAVSPDGSRIITVRSSPLRSLQTALEIRNAFSGAILMNLDIETTPLALTFSSRGGHAAICCDIRTVLVWDLERDTSMSYQYDLPDATLSMTFSSDDSCLSILSSDVLTRISVISDNSTGMRLDDAKLIPLDDPLPNTFSLHRGERHIFLTGEETEQCTVHGSHAVGGIYTAVAFDTKVNIYQDALRIATFQLDYAVTALEFAPLSYDHRLRLAIGKGNGLVDVWSQKDMRLIHTFDPCINDDRIPRPLGDAVRSLAFFSHGTSELLASATCGMDRSIRVWSLNTGDCVWSCYHDEDINASLVFLPPASLVDHRLLLVTYRGLLQGWDASVSASPESYLEPTGLRDMRFSPFDHSLATCGFQQAHVLEIQTGDLQSVLPRLDAIESTCTSVRWACCDCHGAILHVRHYPGGDSPMMRDPLRKWVPHERQSGYHETWTDGGGERPKNLTWDPTNQVLRYRTAKGDWRLICPLPPHMYPDWGGHGSYSLLLRLSYDAQFLAIGQRNGDVSLLKLSDKIRSELLA